jgi:hypothetical protein
MYYSSTKLGQLYSQLGAKNRCPIEEAIRNSLIYLNVVLLTLSCLSSCLCSSWSSTQFIVVVRRQSPSKENSSIFSWAYEVFSDQAHTIWSMNCQMNWNWFWSPGGLCVLIRLNLCNLFPLQKVKLLELFWCLQTFSHLCPASQDVGTQL